MDSSDQQYVYVVAVLQCKCATLKAFYGVEKSMDQYIQFAFFTGVTKFSKVSVFNDLNNLADITMDHRYVEICGITEREIRDNLDEEVGQLAESNQMTKEDCYAKLKQTYDGYHFEHDTAGMYNPYSLLHVLDAKTFKDYWFETGTPTLLAEVLKKSSYYLDDLTREEVTADSSRRRTMSISSSSRWTRVPTRPCSR